MWIARVFVPVALRGAAIIRIAELGAAFLEDRPVTLLTFGPERLRQVASVVSDDPAVVEQGVIDIQMKHDCGRLLHWVVYLGLGLCHPLRMSRTRHRKLT